MKSLGIGGTYSVQCVCVIYTLLRMLVIRRSGASDDMLFIDCILRAAPNFLLICSRADVPAIGNYYKLTNCSLLYKHLRWNLIWRGVGKWHRPGAYLTDFSQFSRARYDICIAWD